MEEKTRNVGIKRDSPSMTLQLCFRASLTLLSLTSLYAIDDLMNCNKEREKENSRAI